MPATLSILNAVFPPRERPQAIAAWSAVAGVGIVIGPTLGGLLLSHFWWGSVFLINVPLVALALAGVLLIVPETAEPGSHRLDFAGTLMIAGALFLLVDAIIEAPTRGWTGPVTLAEIAAGLAGLGLFTWWELRIPNPLIDLRVFAVRAFSAAAASVTVIFFALFGSLFVLTQYLQLVHGYSPLSAGVRALPFAIAMAAVSPVSTILAGRLGSRVVIPAGIAADGRRPAGPVHGRRAHQLPAAGRGRGDHGRGHGPGDGAGQHHHHDHGSRPPGRGGQRDQRHDPRSRRRPRDRHRRQPGRERLPLEARQRAGHRPPAAAGQPPGHELGRRGGHRRASTSAAHPAPS